ncbi:MAG: hypothetical protein Q9219_000617 [cf. Caloplaca sp. 3 TL-2023]
MYDAFARRTNGRIVHSSLSTQDPKANLKFRKPIAAAYSLNALAAYEPLVDDVIAKFITRLEDAHDVILHLTFSNTIGFMDTGADVDQFIEKLDGNLNKIALMSTMPWTAYWVKHNPIVGFFSKNSHMFANWALKRINERITERKMSPKDPKSSPGGVVDFLDRFLDAARSDNPSGYDFSLLLDWTLVNVMAGADTTAIGLRAVLWFLLKNPSKKEKLFREFQAAKLSIPVSWQQSQQIPYLSACVKEALRLCPAIGLGLERKVPQARLEMPDGYTLHEGTNWTKRLNGGL